VLGGGRYDGLSEAIGGPHVPGVGFAMGIERMIALLQLELRPGQTEVFIAILGAAARQPAIALQRDLRRAGIRTELDYQQKSLKSQMKKAGKLGAAYTVILGEEELAKRVGVVRDMAESSQHEVALNQLVPMLLARMRGGNAHEYSV
jgi:histidyl-tRNA synthetase